MIDNDIDNEGATFIAEAMEVNTTVTAIPIACNFFLVFSIEHTWNSANSFIGFDDEDWCQQIEAACERNSQLKWSKKNFKILVLLFVSMNMPAYCIYHGENKYHGENNLNVFETTNVLLLWINWNLKNALFINEFYSKIILWFSWPIGSSRCWIE